MSLALPFLFALIVSAALVPLCRSLALRLGYVAPRSVRSPETRDKALFGGVAITLTLFSGAAAIGALQTNSVLMICGAVLFGLGLASDVFALKPSTKLVVIIATASVFLYFGHRLYWAESPVVDSIITVFWIVGVTAAFNLLDNMDGLCGGIALIASAAFLLTLLPVPADGQLLLQAQYLAIVVGAVAGFLIYNVHPASIVMGESGSLVVGLNMAAMTLQITRGKGSDLVSIIAVPVLVMLIPIADASLVALSRLLRPNANHRATDHPSHRLVAIGLSERSAVGLLWALAAASGLVAIVTDRTDRGLAGIVTITFIIGLGLLAVYVARIRFHDPADADAPAIITPLGIELGYRRRLVEVLLDLVLVTVAYYGAYRLRFDGAQYGANFPYFLQSFPIVLGTQMVAFFGVGVYRGMWRYFSLSDGVTFAKGVFVGILLAQAGLLYLYRFAGYSLGVFVVYGMLAFLLVVGSRASFRLLSEFMQRQRQTGPRLVIYGADDVGAIAVRHLLNDQSNAYRVLGFVDNDFRKRNARVHGYRVIGGFDHLVGMIMANEVDVVTITHESTETRSLPWLCAKHGVRLYYFGMDWREIREPEAVQQGIAALSGPAELRLVRFPGTWGEQQVARPVERPMEKGDTTLAGAPAAARIRVAHIITRLILGGAQENTLYTAIRQHQDPRFEVTLLCGIDEAREGSLFEEANRAGVKTVVLPSLIREIRPPTDLKAMFDVYRFLRRGRYTIVHTHSSKAGVVGRLAARVAGVPVIVHTIHGLAFHEFQAAWKNRLYVMLERLCAPLTHRLISVSTNVSRAALAQKVGRPRQHLTIFSGMELDLFLSARDRMSVEEAKKRVGIPAGAPVVGKVARLFPLKGHEQFLQAAAAIARDVPEAYFLLVGDGPLRDDLRQQAERLGLGERVVMVGRVPPQEVPDYIQAMDVVVHTSLREGIARVLPQAGAVGKPVVTFDLDGAPEVVRDGVSGYLVAPLDTDAVARRTVELLRDPQSRERLGEAGRAFAADHFSVERMVERINDLYLDLLAARLPTAQA